jgi:hypothetical protein
MRNSASITRKFAIEDGGQTCISNISFLNFKGCFPENMGRNIKAIQVLLPKACSNCF